MRDTLPLTPSAHAERRVDIIVSSILWLAFIALTILAVASA
jgi:hypothetical protein